MSRKASKAKLKIKGGFSRLSRQKLKGKKTDEEVELISLLKSWHNNAKKDRYLEAASR